MSNVIDRTEAAAAVRQRVVDLNREIERLAVSYGFGEVVIEIKVHDLEILGNSRPIPLVEVQLLEVKNL